MPEQLTTRPADGRPQGLDKIDSQPRIRAVALDLDGTMFNTEVVFQASGTELLRRRSIEPPPELWERMMGRRAEEAFQAMIDTCGLPESIDELRIESERLFFTMLDQFLQPMPGLLTLLDRIATRSLPLAVATSSTRGYVEMLLSRFDLLDRFAFTLTAEDVTHGKPHPEIYLRAARQHGVEPGEMLVLEDSEAGTRAAAAAGAHVISIPHEHSQRHDFSIARGVASRLDDPLILALLD
ncbi:MAG: HAD family phosphatase [Planctomycetaceae bacterium]|nr:HAD family phosphatase [Planctomycetaceae bacterium]